MLPDRITVDDTLPEEDVARPALEGFARKTAGPDAALARLHRAFYPVFRAEYACERSGRLPWSSERGEGVALLDGLWAGNHEHLGRYRGSVASTQEVSTDRYDFGRDREGLGRSVLLDFRVDNDRAASFLPDRIEAARESAAFDDPPSMADSLRRELVETFGFPDEFEPSTFAGVEAIDRCYLPFWVVEVEVSDGRDLIGAFRALDELEGGGSDEHGWLATFLREDTTRLSRYAHPTIEQWASAGGADGTDSGADGTDSAGADRAEAPIDGGPTAGDEPIQPEEADLEASTLVEPSPDRCFADVGGMAGLEARLRRSVIDPIERPAEYQEYGLDPVSGVLLHGPPGCGKTYVAGAIAGELDHAFVDVTPADLASKYMGKPAENVRDVFAIARANQPAVLFLDEIDAIASARESDSSTSERQMVNQLLTELEAIADEDVLVVAATNLLDDVDDAILRTGRFDERVEVPPPDAEARREILEIHLEGRPLADDLAIEPIVEETAGYAASDLEHIAADGARRALRAGEPIATGHLREAVEATDSSVPDWAGSALGDGTTVTQPDDVDLNARSLVTARVDRTFEDVGGMADLESTLRESVIDPLEDADRYAEYGLSVTNGVLLHGPPGCGKTYVAGALAGELEHAFLDVSPADLTSKWMGKPARNVADLFEIARANAPCVVFLDEIDAIAGARTGSANRSQRQMVNQLLTELESLEETDVVVVAATNLIEDVDDAVLRSGRFDERVEVPPPDAEAREEILAVHLRDRPVASDLPWDRVVDATDGYAASDLALVADVAAREAMRASDRVRERHLLEAVAETDSSIDDRGEPRAGTN